MTNTALILVDIQNDYFADGLWPVDGMLAAAENAGQLLQAARAQGHLVVHIRHEIPVENAPFFRPGSTGAEIHAAVAPQGDEAVITKFRPNSFHETPLLEMLQQHGISQVTLAGAMSQMCIDATARAACDFGFDVTVVQDACAAKEVPFADTVVPAAQVHATIMGALAGTYAQVVTCQNYLG